MKLHFAYVLVCITAALAQSIAIGTPTGGQTLHVGQSFNVMVERPNTLTGSAEIGVAITLHHCNRSPCEDVTQVLGTILYSGAFKPQLAHGQPGLQPHQNFTVSVPGSYSQGPAVLSVPHSTLIGAGPFFYSEITNVAVNVSA